jgi:hypothetical protein
MSDSRPPEKAPGGLARLVRAVKRLVLNKSGEEYTAQLSGGERYWDEAVAANRRSAEAGRAGPAPGGR